jgi:hypothetical protein
VSRQDAALLGAVLKQLFALPPSEAAALLRRLADDSAAEKQRQLAHPVVQLHLLQRLLQLEDGARALGAWRRLAKGGQHPAQLPQMTLQLAKRLGAQRDNQGLRELAQFLRQRYPEAEQTRQLALYQQQLAR